MLVLFLFQSAKDPVDTIDKACAESVNNFTNSLMETIAKLDSNGVQVLPEGQRGKTTSPQVSSTDYSLVTDGMQQSIIFLFCFYVFPFDPN